MTVRCYHQHTIYTGLSQGQVFDRFPSMLLTITTMVNIVDERLAPSRGEIFRSFPSYKYFLAPLEQYDAEILTLPARTFHPSTLFTSYSGHKPPDAYIPRYN
jgi:hypothetical protein